MHNTCGLWEIARDQFPILPWRNSLCKAQFIDLKVVFNYICLVVCMGMYMLQCAWEGHTTPGDNLSDSVLSSKHLDTGMELSRSKPKALCR